MIAYLCLFSISLEQWLGVFISYVIYNVQSFVSLFSFVVCVCVVKREPATFFITLPYPSHY